MSSTALVLVHDPEASRRERIPGALLPAFAARDIRHRLFSFASAESTVPDFGAYDLLVVMGSNESVNDPSVPWLVPELDFVTAAVGSGLPTIGICFGAQLLARGLGGEVAPAERPERGYTTVTTDDPHLVAPGPWMQLHADSFTVPPGAKEIARNESGPQAFVSGSVLGVQFHPEATVDSFSSWTERWAALGSSPVAGDGGVDAEALRHAIAEHEGTTIRACDQLVGTFCTRHLR
ncbi:type 1 glutamine amidotransferase [Streptomyces sp. NPDC047841]|uniref:type 1 glutamine amidotransferase n=1 Tax=Streptomyces sp. NPDC047841 TaxID=3154708 RepID=UPI0034516061